MNTNFYAIQLDLIRQAFATTWLSWPRCPNLQLDLPTWDFPTCLKYLNLSNPLYKYIIVVE